jgi:hypothetical protein
MPGANLAGERPPGDLPLDFQPSPAFLARQKRLEDAKNLRRPDRVPIAPLVNYYPNIIRAIPNRQMQYDLALRARLHRDAVVEHACARHRTRESSRLTDQVKGKARGQGSSG